jgi:GNAT superfamily N-acetyltransferase
MEYKVGKLAYDVGVPDCRLLIEHHGLRWHSSPESRRRDSAKYLNSIDHGFELLAIYEDEWAFSKAKMCDIIANRLGTHKPESLRPSACDVGFVDCRSADALHDSFHYLGGARASVNVGASYGGKLIACVSFKRPSRQSKHDWELVRMTSDPAYRAHGIWSKLLRVFVRQHCPQSIVSFSDNRLFNGGVYGKLGFVFDGDVKPDYYWVKGRRRHHKSGLRKPNGYPQTESLLRQSQGYAKIWDLGKKRWVWCRPGAG